MIKTIKGYYFIDYNGVMNSKQKRFGLVSFEFDKEKLKLRKSIS